MSKRKADFDDGDFLKPVKKQEPVEHATRFKNKHSLDSDEEDDVKDERLDDEDIEGQEDGTIDFDDGVKITPFNMKEEMEEGHFDKDGTYIFSKEDEVKDAWMDDIDWQKIKEVEGNTEMQSSDEDEPPPSVDVKAIYTEMLNFVKEKETIAKALKRLGGKQLTTAQRLKLKKQKKQESEVDTQAAKDKEDFLTLTGLADKVLSSGNMEVYEMTHEKIKYELKGEEKAKVVLPEDMDDDDALDMFADDIDSKDSKEEKKSSKDVEKSAKDTNGESSKADPLATTELMWEYKWKEADEEIHGPYTSEKMLEWTQDNYFKDGVLCRKVGSEGNFYNSRRIDFDLYT